MREKLQNVIEILDDIWGEFGTLTSEQEDVILEMQRLCRDLKNSLPISSQRAEGK